MLAIGNDELARLPEAPGEGSPVRCPNCGKRHRLRHGTKDGRKVALLGFVKCGGSLYLVALGGRLL